MMTKPTVKLTVKEKTQVSPVTDAHLKNEPTLSQDVLEAVPAWGAAQLRWLEAHRDKLIELEDRMAELEGTASFHLRWREEIFERVSALEPVVGNLFDRVAALEALLREFFDKTEWVDMLEPKAEPEPLCPQGDLD